MDTLVVLGRLPEGIWYTLGLVAALYFVVDAGLSYYKRDLTEADDRMVHILQLFRTAEERLEILCALPETTALAPALCRLAPELRMGVLNYLEMKDFLRARVGPPGWVDKLATDPELARQIQALNNWVCAPNRRSEQCQSIPINAVMSNEDFDSPLVFPPPNYAKAIQEFHFAMKKADRRIEEIERGHNLRYFGFLFVAFLAGGKLANASRAMVKADSVRPPSWIFNAISYAFRLTKSSLKRVAALIIDVCRRLAQQAVALLACYQKARAASPEQQNEAASDQK